MIIFFLSLVFLLVAPFLCPLFASASSTEDYKLIFREELCALGQVTCLLHLSCIVSGLEGLNPTALPAKNTPCYRKSVASKPLKL